MIYSNINKKAEARELEFGTIHQMAFGEKGRGRKLIPVTCQDSDMELIRHKLHENMSIGTTKSGKPKLIFSNASELYMVLSAKGGYTRRGNGVIRVLKSQADNFEVIARGNGADGDAGRIGFWDVVLLKIKDVNKDFIICVRTSGEGYGTDSDMYMFHGGKIHHFKSSDSHEAYDAIDEDMPFTFNDGFDLAEWTKI